MKPNQREQLVKLLLPAVALCAVYGWFFLPAKRDASKKALTAVADARAKAPALQNSILVAQSKLAVAARALQNHDSDKQRARQAWDLAAANCTEPTARNERIEKLNRLLARRGLRVIEDAEVREGKDFKIAPGVAGLCKELEMMSAQLKPQLRKVRIVGRYLDLATALDDLATGEAVAIPVGLIMKQAHLSYHVREWVLLVWI